MYASFFVILVISVAIATHHRACGFPFSGSSCSSKFRQALDEVMSVNDQCGHAVLRDCCEASQILQFYHA